MGFYRIRPLTTADRDALLDMLERCSPESLRARFLTSSPAVGPGYVAALFADPKRYTAVVEYDGRVVAEGSLFFDPGPTAEVALIVEDGAQGHGVGALLAEHLCDQAARRGLRRIALTALAGNARVIRLFRRILPAAQVSAPDAGAVTATFSPARRPVRELATLAA